MRGLVRVLSVVSGLLVLYSTKGPSALAQRGVNARKVLLPGSTLHSSIERVRGASESGLARTTIRKGAEAGRGRDES